MTILTGLTLYPIKSCGGIALEHALLCHTGLASDGIHDRQWMVVDGTGRFLSQRECPAMALVRPQMIDAGLLLHFPGRAAFKLERDLPADQYGAHPVQIWDDTLMAGDCGDPAAAWFSAALGRPCRLVRFHPDSRRMASTQWTAGVEVPTLFSDGFPLLLIGQQSLDDLNHKLLAAGRAALPMNRFRPNLVIDGLEAFEEDYLESMQIGQVVLKPVKPCPRCPIPSVDQDSGAFGPDPLDILQAYRANEKLKGAITFGMNLILLQGEGLSIRLGQQVAAVLAF